MAGPRKAIVHADPKRRAGRATRDVLAELLQVTRHNAAGIGFGASPEYLHQFRVAVRGTRVILPGAKELYSTASITRLREELRWIAGLTNTARDFDTLSLSLPEYLDGLAASEPVNVDPLIDLIRRRAYQETALVATIVSGRRFGDIVSTWKQLVRKPGGALPQARRPAKKVARAWIRRRYESAATFAKRTKRSAGQRELHDLRKALKKLRYQIAFFQTLFAAKRTRRILATVKRGQTILGVGHDAGVHRLLVGSLARELLAHPLGGPEAVMVAGEVRAFLRLREEEQRRLVPRWRKKFLAMKREVWDTF